MPGHTDTDLNATGVAQAKATAKYLKALGVRFDAVYSSDLKRARQTAQHVVWRSSDTFCAS